MEQKLPILTKKIWSLARAIFFTLKKDVSKKKFLLHFNTLMKRGKIAEKSPLGEYEFSCRNTPSYPLSLFSTHKKHQNYRRGHSNSNLPLSVDDCDDITIDPTVIKVLNMMTSPAVEHLKIADSPVPVAQGYEDGQVDEAADKFIRRFFSDLRQQNI
ncbi:hypothetical protein Hdeb2414_s0002g00044071 [Helianthus debilis subsp. tardiflorus]